AWGSWLRQRPLRTRAWLRSVEWPAKYLFSLNPPVGFVRVAGYPRTGLAGLARPSWMRATIIMVKRSGRCNNERERPHTGYRNQGGSHDRPTHVSHDGRRRRGASPRHGAVGRGKARGLRERRPRAALVRRQCRRRDAGAARLGALAREHPVRVAARFAALRLRDDERQRVGAGRLRRQD